MRTSKAVRVLNDAIDYLYSFREDCRSRDQFEDLSISLRLLGLARARRGLFRCFPAAFMWPAAVVLATGCSPKRYIEERRKRAEFMADQLMRCTPDYDPAEARRAQERRRKS
jgi:hypothetical protein